MREAGHLPSTASASMMTQGNSFSSVAQCPSLRNGNQEARWYRSREFGLWRQTDLRWNPPLTFTNFVSLGESLPRQSLVSCTGKWTGRQAGRLWDSRRLCCVLAISASEEEAGKAFFQRSINC